ncbi:MAG: AgmX/PglI C-terminal domain-containing protein, partial [Kofleriaceae bacterium]
PKSRAIWFVAGGGGAAPKGGVGGDSMEDLLAAASGGAQKPTQGGDSGAAKPEKTGLDGKDIRSGMGAVAKQAQACYDQHGVAGHVKVKATVDPSGKVTKVEAQGAFAGTPTGSCVAAAAKSASFPEWTGAPMTISYGFTLTE